MVEGSKDTKSLETTVFKVIRDYVSQHDPEGLQHIQSFQDNLGTDDEIARTKEFDQYLKALLLSDPNVNDKLISSNRENTQFVNIVAGGHVEKIVNIARSGAVHIHKQHFLITHRSFVLLLSVIAVVSLVLGGFYWQSKQPTICDDDFNIAVATFDTDPESQNPEIAETVSKAIYDFIDSEFNSPQYNLNVCVVHKNIGVVSGEDHAAELAKTINAHIIIYGTITIINDNLVITPRFYIANTIKADAGELIGSHQFDVPQSLSIIDFPNLLIEGREERENLLQNSEMLIHFTQGLTYLILSEKEEVGRESFLRLALESIQKAITKSNMLKDEAGIEVSDEVLYLFASHLSLLCGNQNVAKDYIDEALSTNDCYGRAYIAQGNIYYDIGITAHANGDDLFQDHFDQAINSYSYALEIDSNPTICEIQPYGYYLPAKAHTGLGNIFSFLFQVGPDAMNPDLAEKALESFEHVISVHNNLPEDDPGRDMLTKIAANAQYQSGVIYLIQEETEQAIEKFKLVIHLEDCTPLADKAKDQLVLLGEVITDSCGE